MKRWQVLMGVVLLIVLATSWEIIRSAAANSREAAAQFREAADREHAARKAFPPQESVATKHFLEVGRIYEFSLPNNGVIEKCEVVEPPHDGWVKVRNLKGTKAALTWFNLRQVVFVLPLQKDD